MNKRNFLKKSLIAGIGTAVTAGTLNSITNSAVTLSSDRFSDNPDELKQLKLPYDFNALEPHIDSLTMEIHYSRHHAAYTRNFLNAIEAENLKGKSLKEIFKNVSTHSASVRNNGGGHFNHNLFWETMSPNGGGLPKGDLLKSINKHFGSFDKFKEEFSRAGATRFGSGWAWLIWDGSKLKVSSTPNQDNPLMNVAEVKGKPILGLDVWEHAYYLHYQNRRGDYINAFWNVVNWNKVEEYFLKYVSQVII